MNPDKVQDMKIAVEQFFYKIKFNINIHNAIKKATYKKFRDALEESLKKQILYYAKFERINDIIGKAVRTLTDVYLLRSIEGMWIELADILPEEILDEFIIFSADEGGNAALSRLKVKSHFSLTDAVFIAALLTRKENLLTTIDNSTKSWIVRTIEEGVSNGISIVDIAKSIRDSASDLALTRSEIIAEYEMHKIMSETMQEVYRRSNIDLHKWVTSHDEKVCDACVENESAGVIKVGGMFPDGSITPPSHLSCRCFTLPVFDNLENIWVGE